MDRQTPPEKRRLLTDEERRELEERIARADRRAVLKKREERRRREAKKARAQLAMIAVAAVAVIAVIAIVVALAVRSHNDADDEAGLPTAASRDELAVTIAAPAETEPPETASPVEYAETTKTTRKLTDNEIASKHAIMIDLSTNEVIMARDGDARIFPASMTKMMTLIVAYEHAADLEQTFTMTEDILGRMWVENATVAGFSVGEKVRLDDLILNHA